MNEWKIQRFLQAKTLIFRQSSVFVLEKGVLFKMILSTIFNNHKKTGFLFKTGCLVSFKKK